jgi:hypothetical protein
MDTNKLPDFCFAINDEQKNTIMIKKGIEGYSIVSNQVLDVKIMNEKLGITDEQKELMILGSMFGFNIPKLKNLL